GRLQVDWALVSPVGFDAVNGAMDYLWNEATVARAMLGRANKRVVLADSSKLGQASRIQIGVMTGKLSPAAIWAPSS
ncbi:hypothetical protein ABTK45_19740, partial [Acinetobacter baumannii]